MTTKHSTRPIVAWSPLNPDTLPWLNDLADGLAKRGCHFVLLTDGAIMPGCRFPALQVPFSLPAYPARFASGARTRELPAELANLLAQRSRAWWGRPTESLDSHLTATYAAAAFFDRLFRRLKPALVLTWGSSLPQSTIIQHLAECRRVPSFILERGLLPGTLMLDQRGHGGRSDLNTFLGSPALSESPLNPAAYQQARDYYLRNSESKYPQAARLSPEEIRRRHAPDAKQVVAFFGQWDAASGLLPEAAGDATLQSPAFSSTAAGLRAIEDAVREVPGTALWFKPHPHDPTDYTAIVQAGTTLFRDASLRDVIEASDATAFMLSTAQFEAALHEKPCVLMARSQLWGKGVAYEVEAVAQLPTAVRDALAAKDLGQRCERQRSWLGGVLRNYLVRTRPEIPAGRSLEDLAAFLTNNSLPVTGSVEIARQLSLLAQDLSLAAEIEAPSSAAARPNALTARLIAFHLPQFHPIPENDRWWGRGFTEWTNVAKAQPRFPEHYQPHLPGELGFYDLRLADVRAEQAQLARMHGIEGFCYWHYWFNGKRLLERPVEDMLASGQPDFPFCLAWANENWTRRWDGNDREMLQEQTYGGEADDRAHFQSLLPAFQDSRAIRVGNRPLFLIYRPASLPDAAATIRIWRELAHQAGLPGLYLVAMRTCFDGFDRDWREAGFDAELYFQPDFSESMQKEAATVGLTKDLVVPYAQAWRAMSKGAEAYVAQRNAFPSVVPSWDNSARRKSGSFIFHNSTPEEYALWLRKEISGVQSRPQDQRLVFLNAWNEWAEGNHLEPDQRWGRAYLEVTRNAVTGQPIQPPRTAPPNSPALPEQILPASINRTPVCESNLTSLPGPHPLEVFPVQSCAAFEQLYQARFGNVLREQQRFAPAVQMPFTLPGYCAVCGCEQKFMTDFLYASPDANGRLQPSWRERQICQCGLNSRQRACFHVLAEALGLAEGSLVYCTEQQGALFRLIRQRFPFTLGSEFLGDKVPLGETDMRGIRNEDLTRLTYPDDSFDCIVSLEVLEHVPAYSAALAELARCLKPGGKLLLTTPIHFNKEKTVVRAGFDADGKLTHYLPPVYHGDPLSADGCLCFNDFGWDLLDEIKRAGFTDAAMHFFTSAEYGYLGMQCVVLATREAVLANRSMRRARPQVGVTRKPVPVRPQKPIETTETLQQRAAALRKASNWKEASEAYLILGSRLPDDLAIWQARLECARQQGHAVMADLILEEALERHPEWAVQLGVSPKTVTATLACS